MNLFNINLYAESVLGEFLDKYFYSKLIIQNFERVKDKNRQFQGVDVVFDCNNQKFIVDEKGYLSRHKIQDTFVLELSYLNKNKVPNIGWLFDTKKVTTHYLLCWADRDNVKLEDLKIDNIKLVEAWLVNKKKLLSYIDITYKINMNNIDTKVQESLEKTKVGPVQLSNKSRIVHSRQLKEKPLNIVMTKKDYLQSGSVEGKYKINHKSVTIC